jgi:anti-anti-sigma factor
MRITRDETGNALKISGTADMSAAEALRSALAASFEQDGSLDVDLSEVDECDSSAVQLLCAAHRSAERSGKSLRILAMSRAIAETGSALGLPMDELSFERRA